MAGIKETVRANSGWLIAIAIAAATFAAYANTLHAPFIFDDIHGILRNSTLSRFRTAWRPPVGEALSGRPVANLTFAVNRAISGDAVWSYHVINSAIHAAAALLLFGVIRRMLAMRTDVGRRAESRAGFAFGVASVTALLWCVHPLQTEAVTFTIQRVESLMALFYLATLYAFLRGVDSSRPGAWLLASVSGCALGMATKEVMVSAPVIVLLYDRTFVAGSFAAAWRQRRSYYLGLAATWIVLALCVLQAGARVGAAGAISAPSPWQYLTTQAVAIPRYVRLAFWPADQVFDYGYGTLPFGVVPALGLMALAAAFVMSAWAVRQRRSLGGFAVLCFFAVLAPSSSILPLTQQTVAEHRMYLPLAAVIATVVGWVWARIGLRALAVFGMAAVALAGLTVLRNRLYHSRLDLWRDTTAKAPANARAWAYLAHRLSDAGRWGDALVAAQTQLRVDPRYTVDADAIIGRCLLELGRTTEALPHLVAATNATPKAFDVRINLGIALAGEDRLDEAAQQYEVALRLNPTSAEAHGNLANALVRLGRRAEAWPHYESAAAAVPHDPQPELNWAASLAEAGDPQAAVPHFRRAITLGPNSAAAHVGFAAVLAETGDLASARAECERALQIDPQHVGAKRLLESLGM